MEHDDQALKDNTIDVNGLDAIIQFTQYSSDDTSRFLDGLLLAHNLINKHGTILLPQGTEFKPKHIERLMQFKSADPKFDFDIKLKRSPLLIQRFRTDIKEHLFSIFDRQKKTAVFNGFLDIVSDDLDGFVDAILSEENFTILLYQMCFVCGAQKKNKTTQFMEQPLNVALISLAMASSKTYSSIIGKDKQRLLDISMAALLHNHGALQNLEAVITAHVEDTEKLYWKFNKEGIDALQGAISTDVRDALHMLYDYQAGRIDFIDSTEWSAVIANILIVGETLLRNEVGLFGDKTDPRAIVDKLNVKVNEHAANELTVEALTLGLNLMDIFDFYRELNHLTSICPINCAVSYPLEGFMSPTMIVCQRNLVKCKHIEGSLLAVNLVRDSGQLKRGQYRRCLALTPRLTAYYAQYYQAIKGVVNTSEVKSN